MELLPLNFKVLLEGHSGAVSLPPRSANCSQQTAKRHDIQSSNQLFQDTETLHTNVQVQSQI